jgi:aryl sulfotransferase
MDAPLVLIASYPKSGNTWTRAVLQGILTPEHAGDINRIDIGLYGQNRRALFDHYAPASAAELTPEEIDRFLPAVLREFAADTRALTFLKVHDAARRTDRGEWLYPPEAVRAVLYLVRHPFDVALSFSHHMGWSVDETVRVMADPGYSHALARKSLPTVLQERDGTWSGNVASWLAASPPYNVVALRYEDLKRDALAGFRIFAAAAGLPTDAWLAHAVQATRFERLQAIEKSVGFRERPHTSPAFFRAGGSIAGKERLGDDARRQIVRAHGAIMQRLGYREDGTTSDIADMPLARFG